MALDLSSRAGVGGWRETNAKTSGYISSKTLINIGFEEFQFLSAVSDKRLDILLCC